MFVVRDTAVKQYSRNEKTKFRAKVNGETVYLGVIFAVDRERQQAACWWLHGSICCCDLGELRAFTAGPELAQVFQRDMLSRVFPNVIDPSLYAKTYVKQPDSRNICEVKMKPCAYTSKIYGPESLIKDAYRDDAQK